MTFLVGHEKTQAKNTRQTSLITSLSLPPLFLANRTNWFSLGLERLCEFIEDCEFPALATQVLHLLGSEGPSTSTPTKYIRYIYNRVCLETEKVRASAVSALAQFGLKHAGLRPKIAVLLRRFVYFSDYFSNLNKNRFSLGTFSSSRGGYGL